jgi:hypothetical protein
MRGRAFAAGALLLLLVPAAATADVRTGSITDPTGDAPVPQRDITAAEFTYDTQGSTLVKVTLAAAPDTTTAAGVGARIGPASPGPQCAGGLASLVEAPSGDGDSTLGGLVFAPPTVTVQGNVVSITYSGFVALANQPWDCGFAIAAEPGGGSITDLTDQVALQGGAPPPPPPPPPPAARPSCRVAKSKVRKGRPLAVRCTGVTGVVSARFKRRGSRARKVNARVDARGRGGFSTRKLRRGRYKVTVSQKGQRLGGRTVRVR